MWLLCARISCIITTKRYISGAYKQVSKHKKHMKKLITLFALFVTLVSCDNMVQTNYYPNDLKESEGRTIEGHKTGEWNYWDENGNLTKT